MVHAAKPASTTRSIWTGALLIVAGVVVLLGQLSLTVPVDDSYVFPFAGNISQAVVACILLAGFILLAGVRRDTLPITGAGRSAMIALVLFGAIELINLALIAVLRDSPTAFMSAATVARLVVLVAGIYAAFAVRRVAIADSFMTGALLACVGVQVVLSLLETLPSPATLHVAGLLALLWPVSLMVLGAAAAINGRRAAESNRLRVVHTD